MYIETNSACCFTGHRIIDIDRVDLQSRVLDTISKCVSDGYRTFIAGGAFGFDTLAAMCVVESKAVVPTKIRLVLFLPGKDQSQKWSDDAKLTYRRVLRYADDIFYFSERCSSEIYLRRDRAMVEASSRVIAYYDMSERMRSGTGYTVRYARRRGREILYI